MKFFMIPTSALIALGLLISCGTYTEKQSSVSSEPSYEELAPALEKNLIFGIVKAATILDQSDQNSITLSNNLLKAAEAGIPDKIKPFYSNITGIKISKEDKKLKLVMNFKDQIISKVVARDKKLGHKIGLYFSRDYTITADVNITGIKADFEGIQPVTQPIKVFYKLVEPSPMKNHPWEGKNPVGIINMTGFSAQSNVKGFSRKEFSNSPTTRMMIYENNANSHIIVTNSNYDNNDEWFSHHGKDPSKGGWFSSDEAFKPYPSETSNNKPVRVTFLDLTAASEYRK